MTLSVRFLAPKSEDEARAASIELFQFLLPLHAANGIGAPNPGKAMQGVYDVITKGAALVAELDGQIVGSIGLCQADIWYSDDPALAEQWFWIDPAHRDGVVLQALLAEVAQLADDTGSFVTLAINNPNRKRVPGTRLQRIGDSLSYQPRGAAYVIAPEER